MSIGFKSRRPGRIKGTSLGVIGLLAFAAPVWGQQNWQPPKWVQGESGKYVIGGPTDGTTWHESVIMDLDQDGYPDLLVRTEKNGVKRLAVSPAPIIYDAHVPDIDDILSSGTLDEVRDFDVLPPETANGQPSIVCVGPQGLVEVLRESTGLVARVLDASWNNVERIAAIDATHVVGAEALTIRVSELDQGQWSETASWSTTTAVVDLCSARLNVNEAAKVIVMSAYEVDVYAQDGTLDDNYDPPVTSIAVVPIRKVDESQEWFGWIAQGPGNGDYLGIYNDGTKIDSELIAQHLDTFAAATIQRATPPPPPGQNPEPPGPGVLLGVQSSHKTFELKEQDATALDYDKNDFVVLGSDTAGLGSNNHMTPSAGDLNGDGWVDVCSYDGTLNQLIIDFGSEEGQLDLTPTIEDDIYGFYPRLHSEPSKMNLQLRVTATIAQIEEAGANAVQLILFEKSSTATTVASDAIAAAVKATIENEAFDQIFSFELPGQTPVPVGEDPNVTSVYYCLARLVKAQSGHIQEATSPKLVGFQVGDIQANLDFLDEHNWVDEPEAMTLWHLSNIPPPSGIDPNNGGGDDVGSGSNEPCMPAGNGMPGCGPCTTWPE